MSHWAWKLMMKYNAWMETQETTTTTPHRCVKCMVSMTHEQSLRRWPSQLMMWEVSNKLSPWLMSSARKDDLHSWCCNSISVFIQLIHEVTLLNLIELILFFFLVIIPIVRPITKCLRIDYLTWPLESSLPPKKNKREIFSRISKLHPK